MTEKANNAEGKFLGSDDPTLLAVKGHFLDRERSKDFIKGLSSAICVVYQKHNTVKLRCIGAASLNNAIKASILASADLEKKDIHVVLRPYFTTVLFEEGQERTAIVLEIVKK